jgi:hypothetical protein
LETKNKRSKIGDVELFPNPASECYQKALGREMMFRNNLEGIQKMIAPRQKFGIQTINIPFFQKTKAISSKSESPINIRDSFTEIVLFRLHIPYWAAIDQ